MCGIYGYIGERQDAASLVVEGLRRLVYRGYDSWGVAAAINGQLQLTRRTGAVDTGGVALPVGPSALGHTRWATHGAVTEANAHPHVDCSGRLALVHNGIVENAVSLRAHLQASGHQFASETDSEVIVHLIEEQLLSAPSLHHAMLAAFGQLHGINGVAVLDAAGDVLVAATNGAPLAVGLGLGEAYVASDLAAIPVSVETLVVLEDGQVAIVEPETVRVLDMTLGAWVAPRALPPQTREDQVSLPAGEHWMEREIQEQPRLLRLLATDAAAEATAMAAAIRDASSVAWVGCGTSYHASLYGRYLLARSGERSHAIPGSEFAYVAGGVGRGSLLFALSQSGETIDILDAVRTAHGQGARVTALVNAGWSTLARQADTCIRLRAGPERCVLATKSFLAELGVITLMDAALRGDTAKGGQTLRAAADATEELLVPASRERIRDLARIISASNHLFCLGRGRSTAIALEAALKIKEGSYIHAEGFSSGELKHGVIALIEPGIPCLLFAPEDETQPAVVSAALEVAARGALTVAIAPAVLPGIAHTVVVEHCGEGWWLAASVVAQLLAYELAVLRGHDPDRPRNLAKSVTVR